MTSHAVTVAVFVAIGLALLTLELVARLRGPGGPVPTLGSLLRWALRRRSTQLGLLLAWWWVGWHFFVG